MKCEHTKKGDDSYYCEHCHQMGRKVDLEEACPYREKPKCPLIPWWHRSLEEPVGTGGWG